MGGEEAPPDPVRVVSREGDLLELILLVHVQPGAGRSELVGRHGDALKVRVSAPAVDGRATAGCLDLVAGLLGVPTRQATLESGGASRRKRVRVVGVRAEALARFEAGLAGSSS
jgi:hypothetical protein